MTQSACQDQPINQFNLKLNTTQSLLDIKGISKTKSHKMIPPLMYSYMNI